MLKSIKSSRDRLASKISGSLSSKSCSSSSSSTEEATSRSGDVRPRLAYFAYQDGVASICVFLFVLPERVCVLQGIPRRACCLTYMCCLTSCARYKILIFTCRQQDTNDGMVHQSHGHVRMQGQKFSRVSWSSAGYQAKAPWGDINIHQVGLVRDMPCIICAAL